jgi:hypothetical protein
MRWSCRIAAPLLVVAAVAAQDDEPIPVPVREDTAAWRSTEPVWATAFDRALAAVRRAQRADGSFAAEDRADANDLAADTVATALAVLALAADGSTLRMGAGREPIRLGIKWLRDQQDENGDFAARAPDRSQLLQVLATLAMNQCRVDAHYTLLHKNVLRGLHASFPLADRAIDPLTAALGLRLLVPHDQFAQDIDIRGPLHDRLRAALLPQIAASGLCTWRGPQPDFDGAGPDPAETATAVALAAHLRARDPAETLPHLEATTGHMLQWPQRWALDGSGIDGLTLAFGAEAASGVGGATWTAWRAGIEQRVLPRQQQGGEGDGTFAFACGHRLLHHRTAATALAALALTAPLRKAR